MRLSSLSRLLPSLLLLAACDPLVDSSYDGKPLFQVDGRIVDFQFGNNAVDVPIASLFWTTGDTTQDPSKLSAESDLSVAVSFPATVRINIFEAPDFSRIGDAPFAIGELLIWEDSNHDGAFSEGEYLGGAVDQVLLYAQEELSSAESPTGRVLPPGFSVANLPLPCRELDPLLEGTDCGVPLGDSCVNDAACGAPGECLLKDGNVTYPGGYCVLPLEACTPADGVDFFVGIEKPRDIWIKRCAQSDECREGYSCEPWIGGCLPKVPFQMILAPELEIYSLCEAGEEHDPDPPLKK